MNNRKYSVVPKNPRVHKDLPIAEVFFPTISEDHCVLNHVHVVAHKSEERRKEINSKIKYLSYSNLNKATIDSFVHCGRFCESTSSQAGIEISMGSSDFFDKSYALALVIADHLARKTPKGSTSRYVVAATGELQREADQISKVGGIKEKAETLIAVGHEVGVNMFVFPKANEEDVPVAELENAGIECLAISKVSEALAALNIPVDSSIEPDPLPVRRLTFSKPALALALGFVAISGVTAAYIASNLENASDTVSDSAFIREELVNALNDYKRYPEQWGRVEEVIRLTNSLKPTDLALLSIEQRNLINEITLLASLSDEFQQNVIDAIEKLEQRNNTEYLQQVYQLYLLLTPLERDRLRLYNEKVLSSLLSFGEKYLIRSLLESLELYDRVEKLESVHGNWMLLSDVQRSRFSDNYPRDAVNIRKLVSELQMSNERIERFVSAGKTLDYDTETSVNQFLERFQSLTPTDLQRLKATKNAELSAIASELSLKRLIELEPDALTDESGLLVDLYLLPHNSTTPPKAPLGDAISSYVHNDGGRFSFAEIYNDIHITRTIKDKDRGMHYHGYYDFPNSGDYLFSFNFQSGEHLANQWTRECRVVVTIAGSQIFDKVQTFGEGQSYSNQVSVNVAKGKEPFDLWFACENLNDMGVLGPKWDINAYKNTSLEILVRAPSAKKLTLLPVNSFSH